MQLSPNIVIRSVKDGYALFNTFTYDTHFIPTSFSLIIEKLEMKVSKDELIAYAENTQVPQNELEQFLGDGIKSGIILG